MLHLLAGASLWVPQPSGSTPSCAACPSSMRSTPGRAARAAPSCARSDGEHWEKLKVPGGEALDFRDVEALDAQTVVLMSAGPGDASRIYRSTDAGTTWKLVHTNPDKDGFYDAIAFWDAQNGVVLGDPVRPPSSSCAPRTTAARRGRSPRASSCRRCSGRGRLRGERHLPDRRQGLARRVVRHRRCAGLARLPHERSRPRLELVDQPDPGRQRLVGALLGRVPGRRSAASLRAATTSSRSSPA